MKSIFTGLFVFGAMVTTLSTGSALAQTALPYEVTFNTQANVNTWKILDINSDGDSWGARCWAWQSNNSYLRFNLTSSSGIQNDWIISPAFNLEAGTQYEISYYFRGDSSSAKNIPVSLQLVTSDTEPENNGTILASYPINGEGTTDKNAADCSATFTVETTGIYYIGAHVTTSGSSSQNGRLVFRNFGLKALQKATAPGSITSASITPDEAGANNVTINYTLPTLDAEGNELKGDVRINIYSEDNETILASTPYSSAGESGEIKLDNCKPGETWFTLKPENNAGEGQPLRLDVYVGEDVPTAVTNLKSMIGEDDNVVISWSAPSSSAHNCYLDYSNLKYRVSREIEGQIEELAIVDGLSFTDDNLAANKQTNVCYEVVGCSNAGVGTPSKTTTLNYGASFTLPFEDSFTESAFQTNPWRQEVIKNFEDANFNPQWDIIKDVIVVDNVTDDNPEGDEIAISPQDNDNGMLRFNSNAVGKMRDDAIGRLVSPSVDFSEMLNPVLSFWMMRESYYTTNPESNGGYRDDYVQIEVSADNSEFTPIEGAEFHRYGKENGWVYYEVPLYSFCGKSRVQFALTGHGFAGGPIYIDNLRIEERTAYDLQAVAFGGPARVRVGESADYQLSIKNAGGFDVNSYRVELQKDGIKVSEIECNQMLKPGKLQSIKLSYSPEIGIEGSSSDFSAKIIYDVDQDLENNTSSSISTFIASPLLPGIKSIKGNVDGDMVKLSWGTPDYLASSTLVEEDGFESYEPFVINSFGDFSCFDLDGKVTYGIGSAAGIVYPNSGEKMAFQIFAPTLTNIDEEELGLWATHNGSNMAIAPQAQSQGRATASNDWLVFPRLSGNAQTIKFFARSLNENYGEFVQGFYASINNPTEADDFLPCPDGGDISYSVPTEWTEITYSVPKGAKYFALRHVSADGYALMVDDVTYERAIPDASEIGLLGYYVYCNEEKINEEPITEQYLEYKPSQNGTYSYQVSAAYPDGESSCSEMLTLVYETSGIDDLAASSYAITTNGLNVTIIGADGMNAALYTPSGLLVAQENCYSQTTLNAPAPGIYVLMIGSRSVKVVLK